MSTPFSVSFAWNGAEAGVPCCISRTILSSPGAAPGDLADGIIPSSEVAVFGAGSLFDGTFFTWVVS